MPSTTFSALLTQLMAASEMNLKKTHEYINSAGVNISYPSLSSYKAFTAVPTYERALSILQAFDYPVQEDELREMLEYSRSELKDLKEDTQQYIQQSVRLSPKFFENVSTVQELSDLINERIEDIDIGTFNNYISMLIKNDLIEAGLL